MDLLYGDNVNAFALMTSDSDFTPLVMRLLESGFTVYGFGETKTPQPFVDACSQFIYTENLEEVEEPEANTVAKAEAHPSPKKQSRNELRMNTALVKLLRTAVEQTSDEEGWAHWALWVLTSPTTAHFHRSTTVTRS
jgi:hypothetical protein